MAPSAASAPAVAENRTIKEATVQRYHYDSHQQFEAHLADFVSAYNFGRRLKTLRGLTPYEVICRAWTKEPQRFRLDPLHQMPGLNSRRLWRISIEVSALGSPVHADRRRAP